MGVFHRECQSIQAFVNDIQFSPLQDIILIINLYFSIEIKWI